MSTPPELPRAPQNADAGHVELLAIFHFVLGGLSLLGLGFLFLHWLVMDTMMSNPEMWKTQPGGPPPEQILRVFKWMYLFFGVGIVVMGVANVLSGFFLRQRRHRTFSLVISGVNCLAFPFGTALGVFTIIVLSRDSVRAAYESVGGRPA